MPEKIRVSTMDSLRLFMDEEAVADTEASYMEDGDLYVLDPHVDKETREKLNEDFGKPMLILAGLTEGGEETEGMLSAMGFPEGTDPLQAIMQMPEEARKSDDFRHGRTDRGNAGIYRNPGGGIFRRGRV